MLDGVKGGILMKQEEKEKKVIEAWEKYSALMSERRELEKEVKALKAEEEAVKGLIVSLVPEGKEVGGVEHKVSEKVSVSYGKAFEAVVNEYVPKTKREQAKALKEEFTSRKVYHDVKGPV